jgi:heterodisulfide reductase subunit A-like polyferredoxin
MRPCWRRKGSNNESEIDLQVCSAKKSRYVSIQVGIGWKPMDASDVDRLGYGDCKG